MKTTYIIGAGFSRYANLPLMNDFYFKSKDIYFTLKQSEDKKAFENVFEYFDEFSKVKHIMNADFYNIEELLSVIEMDSFIKGNDEIKKDYLMYLKKVIEECTPKSTDTRGNYIINGLTKTTEIYTNFIKIVYGIDDSNANTVRRDVQNDNGIISLNYDMILEISLKRIEPSNYEWLDYDYGIKDELVDYKYTMTPHLPKLKLAKIHGSINFHKDGLPIIIPPTWNKSSNSDMISVWKLAHDLLSSSEEIVFIGYSLPETDLYVKYLLISGIKDCNNLKKIYVICPDENGAIQKRYENFFDLNYRNKAFKFIRSTFEDSFSNRHGFRFLINSET